MVLLSLVLGIYASSEESVEDSGFADEDRKAETALVETVGYGNLTETKVGEWLLIIVAPWSLASRRVLSEVFMLAASIHKMWPDIRVAKIDEDGEDKAVRFMFAVESYPTIVFARNGDYRAYIDNDSVKNTDFSAIGTWIADLKDGNQEDFARRGVPLDPFAPEYAGRRRWLHFVSAVSNEGIHFVSIFSVKPLMVFSFFALALAVILLLVLIFSNRRGNNNRTATGGDQPGVVHFMIDGESDLDSVDSLDDSEGFISDFDDFEQENGGLSFVINSDDPAVKKAIMRRLASGAHKTKKRNKSRSKSRSKSRGKRHK